MERAERAALIGIAFGAAAGVIASIGPLAYPDLPIAVWRTTFWIGVAIGGSSLALLVLEYVIKKREGKGKGKMPLFLIIMGACLFVIGSIWYYLEGKSAGPVEFEPGKILEAQIKDSHSRFGIVGYSLYRPTPDIADAASIIDIRMVNDGEIAGDKPMLNWNIIAIQVPFSDDDIDVQFESIYKKGRFYTLQTQIDMW